MRQLLSNCQQMLLQSAPPGPPIGVELIANGDFAGGATGWTLSHAAIAAGQCTFDGTVGAFIETTLLQVLVVGQTYHFTADDVILTLSTCKTAICEAPPGVLTASSPPYDRSITVVALANGKFRFTDSGGNGVVLANLSLKRTA